jgi:hypothetical protein
MVGDSEFPAPLACRLDKMGWRFLCGRIECGTEICRVDVWYDKHQPSLDDVLNGYVRPRGQSVVARNANFNLGWKLDNGIWTLTKRSERRIRRKLNNQEPQAIVNAPGPGRGAYRDDDGKWVHPFVNRPVLPVLARCPNPSCRRVNLIQAQERPSIDQIARRPSGVVK